MCPFEIVAYKVDGMADIENFDAPVDQLDKLLQMLRDTWKEQGFDIDIVYRGTDIIKASKAIEGIPRVSSEI